MLQVIMVCQSPILMMRTIEMMQAQNFHPFTFQQHLADQFKAMNESNPTECRATKLHNSLLESRTTLNAMTCNNNKENHYER
jgi:hypothetical protein